MNKEVPNHDTKIIAWNGIYFKIPKNWEPVSIKNSHLLFEENSRPAMEIKWFKNSEQTLQVKKLFKNFSTISSPPTSLPIPADWGSSLSSYQSKAFSWKQGSTGAIGLLLHCEQCSTSTLIQFFYHNEKIPLEIGAKILNSLKDHDCGNKWSIFDIEATLPDNFTLSTSSFRTGRFEIKFSSADNEIHLFRFAIASEMLKSKTLKDLATEIFTKNNATLAFIETTTDACQWQSPQKGFLSRLALRIRRKPLASWGKLWHDRQNNKLLAVLISGDVIDHNQCAAITGNFHIA